MFTSLAALVALAMGGGEARQGKAPRKSLTAGINRYLKPHQGRGEKARRISQIKNGTLTASNGVW